MLAENAFEGEAEALRRALRRLVAIVALPFPAPVAEPVEGILHEQEMRFGRCGFPRHQRTPIDIADLDNAVRGIDPHEGLSPGDLAAHFVDDGEEERIPACLSLV